ncbi:MAG: PhnD/SsuA/transferrin family substrate-binding protein [Gemmatimonadaceae bacterium]|nr:PhnD/SsuA/transferrin family substrate-binding protein [Gemmatimonadaceae bacterium]
MTPALRPEALQAIHAPLQHYIEREVGLPVDLVIPRAYGDLVAMLDRKAADVAYVNGVEYVIALRHADIAPIAVGLDDLNFTTSFIARASDTTKSLAGFRGRRLRLGESLSTAGYVMARRFLVSQGLAPESAFADITQSSTHEETAEAVRDGKADLGAVSTFALDRIFTRGVVRRDQVRVVWVSPPFPDQFWIARSTLAAPLRARLVEAFLTLSPLDSVHAGVLRAEGVTGYIPVERQRFYAVEEAVRNAGVLRRSSGAR